jgi:uncharacterized protein YjbI with pentapeptide repeats
VPEKPTEAPRSEIRDVDSRAADPPPLPEPAKGLEAKANDLVAIRDAVVDAAGISAGLWLSYLFVLFYLLVATGGVTHKDLLLENPVKLPFLSVDLPLKGFFVLGPALFLIVHAYVLLHFTMLAAKVRVFDIELREQIEKDRPESEVRTRLRRQLPSNIFVQFLAGPRENRSGIIGFLLRSIAWISLVFGPVLVVIFFELQFLPYHVEWISWWQRIAVVLDLALLWLLWPAIIRRDETVPGWRRGAGFITAGVASVAPLFLIFGIATFQGEWLYRSTPHFPLREAIVEGDVDLATRKPSSFWSNRLVVPGFDVIDHAKLDSEPKIAALLETVSLRSRHLEGAVLIGAGLRKADFTSARLSGAKLTGADLREAKFECTGSLDVIETSITFPKDLDCAQLQNASLNGARLEGASLIGAHLQGARLQGARLQGALLDSAQLQGASLTAARLQGASLDGAELQGAILDSAQLQGADLTNARLQGTSFRSAQLMGASLDDAQLQGAILDFAQLQGTSLHNAQLKGASLRSVFVWRADLGSAPVDARIAQIEPGQVERCIDQPGKACEWQRVSLDRLKKMLEQEVPEGPRRVRALEAVDPSMDPDQPLAGEADLQQRWLQLQKTPLTDEIYEGELAKQRHQTGCAADGAPYVVEMMSFRLSDGFATNSPYVPRLAAALLDSDCGGARGCLWMPGKH